MTPPEAGRSAAEDLGGQLPPQAGPQVVADGEHDVAEDGEAPPGPGAPASTGDAGATGSGGTGALDGDDLAVARAEVEALTGDLQRLQAEYVNYKRRVDRDRELVKQNATFSVLAAMLPVFDDVDRAREHGEVTGGFKAVADALERVVAGQGLVKFGAPGDEFDPRFHEALMHGHSAEVTTTTCQTIISAGYQIGDRVVRPAQVTVVDPAPEPAPDAEPDGGSQDQEEQQTGDEAP